jgi:ectoine hydroxylase-related dioxygenase (phytanoyl-CoA dioxygenase family)
MIRSAVQDAIETDGLAIVRGVFGPDQVACLASDLDRELSSAGPSVLQSRSRVYGARNLTDIWPPALAVAGDSTLREHLAVVLGDAFGLVRSIFFDKPPGRTWSLPWHRDMTIAVRQAKGVAGFHRPTVKAGIPHVEAPAWLLRGMLTARVALDDVDDENGPLLVIPGSHRDTSIDDLPSPQDPATWARPIHMARGDALLIRPLVVHRSGPSMAGTSRNRRTLHFEFAPATTLPGGLEWSRFVPLAP